MDFCVIVCTRFCPFLPNEEHWRIHPAHSWVSHDWTLQELLGCKNIDTIIDLGTAVWGKSHHCSCAACVIQYCSIMSLLVFNDSDCCGALRSIRVLLQCRTRHCFSPLMWPLVEEWCVLCASLNGHIIYIYQRSQEQVCRLGCFDLLQGAYCFVVDLLKLLRLGLQQVVDLNWLNIYTSMELTEKFKPPETVSLMSPPLIVI